MNPKWITHKNEAYENWIRTKPCIVCARTPAECHHVWHGKRNAYVSLPLCREHHTAGNSAYHKLEHESFESVHNIDLSWAIIRFLSEYLEAVQNDKDADKMPTM